MIYICTINSLILGYQDLDIVCRRMWVAYSHSCKVLEWLSWDEIELWIAARFSEWIVSAGWHPPETTRLEDQSLVYKTLIALNPTIFLPSLTDSHLLITAKISQKSWINE